MAADPVTVMAGGISFNLIGRTAEPLGPVLLKFQSAMLQARRKLEAALVVVATAGLTRRQQLVIEYCFNPVNQLELAKTLATASAVLKATLDGLKTDGLNIYEPDPAEMPPQAEGYVQPYGPFRGDIHTLFTLNDTRTTHNLIHEATHKFKRTEDKAYIAASLANWLQIRLHGINGGSPISNANALVNADSFAGAAMTLT